MIPYILVALIIVVLSLLNDGKKSKTGFVAVFVLLTLFAGLRGNFTSDYDPYVELFEQANAHKTFFELLATAYYTEKGFMVLMYLFGRIIPSPVAFFVFLSAVTNLAVLSTIYKQSKYPWLSVLLYVGIGTYYDSFNITRFILVTAVLFFCNFLIEERKFREFLIVVLVMMSIHRMAIIMLPMYFLLNVKVTRKNVWREIGLGAVVFLFLPLFKWFLQKIFKIYASYSFGMEGGTWKTIVIPLAVAVFLLYYLFYNKKESTFNVADKGNQLMLNAFVYQFIFTLCSMRIYMATRMIYFFAPYLWLLLPNVISSVKNKKHKRFFAFSAGVLSILYQIVVYSGTGYESYFAVFTR